MAHEAFGHGPSVFLALVVRPAVCGSLSVMTTTWLARSIWAYASRHLPAPIGLHVAGKPKAASASASLSPSQTKIVSFVSLRNSGRR